MGGFSRVTNFLKDALLLPPEPARPGPQVTDLFPEEFSGMAINTQEETGFEMVTTRELPPRPTVTRDAPLSAQCWARFMDSEGCIKDIDGVKQIIFRGGVDPSLRTEVWKFLLGYYSWDSTHVRRAEQRKQKVDDYFRMKLQWKSITPDQERRFAEVRDRKCLIDKDVLRTDRTHVYYEGDNNANINTLYDILMTYCMYNFDLGYVQGMSDLLSPILVLMENEVDAFWCFAGFMELVWHNFEMDQAGMKRQLHQLNVLLRFVDPQLCNHLESHDSSNMYFCFRWLLIWFKREFNFSDIMRVWEVMWTGLPCRNFHLLMCLAILDTEKTTLIENNFGFTEILKHINDITGTIEVEPMLKKSEAIFLQLQAVDSGLPDELDDIIGEDKDATPSSTPEREASTASTPSERKKNADGMQTQTLHAGDSCNGHSSPPLHSSSSNQHSPNSNQDDSSIETYGGYIYFGHFT
ncbi:hypothetical protein CAPTEDRAFT_181938 [Capitella teleta]|uniref:TBC1 domain family member 15 n=1 Tax=Capitella teleta TaxID=283909 RepID=R7UXF0_CAPTE|nr:hypothetical protein CAPTEDRAFT_181938 [Capitella teleta]|eukprot:ELU08056.1 hypothetical protein CAPTEDRAFT_181938 [Capitella teleta]